MLASGLLAAVAVGGDPIQARDLELPAPSPRAKVEQRVGVLDFAVEYSSPGDKGRATWGGLAPWEELRRTGANATTRLTASKDFTFGEKPEPAGTCSVPTIPTRSARTTTPHPRATDPRPCRIRFPNRTGIR